MYWTNTLLFSHCYLQCRPWAGLGCALAEPSGLWCPTFALCWLEKYVFFIQIICWAPWISQGISAFTCVLIACNMADLQAKYMTSKNTWHTIHHLSLKMFENVRNISKSTANHSTLQFESCNKEHHKILKEAQIIKLQSTTWNWIHPNFCSWLSETNDHSIFPQNMMDVQSTDWGWEILVHCSQISAKEKSYQIHTV